MARRIEADLVHGLPLALVEVAARGRWRVRRRHEVARRAAIPPDQHAANAIHHAPAEVSQRRPRQPRLPACGG
eukprot:5684883-Prymnesium_polylepis.2